MPRKPARPLEIGDARRFIEVEACPRERVLDFDSENFPGFYWYDGKATDRLDTVAWAWVDDPENVSYATTYIDRSGIYFDEDAFQGFIEALAEADAVTGHNILRHDIPLLNGHRLRTQAAPIVWPKVYDTMQMTKQTWGSTGGVSRSQENLAYMWGIEEQKYKVSLPEWERAGAFQPEYRARVVERCISDVKGHIEIYNQIRGVTNGTRSEHNP